MIPQPQFVHQEQEQPVVALSPGKRLQRSREGLGLSQADVASSLRLPLNVIKSLEDDQHDGIHSTYLKGYLRSYARLVGVSTDLVVADVRQTLADRQAEILRAQTQAAQVNSSHGAVKAVTIALCVGLLLLCVTWWRGQQSQTTDAEQTLTAETVPATEPAPLIPPLPAADTPQQAADPVPAETGNAVADRSIAPSDSVKTQQELPPMTPAIGPGNGSPEPETAAKPATTDTVASTQAAPSDQAPGLALKLTGDSWAEITDASGKRLVKKLGKAGETISLEPGAAAPFQVLIGNASQVALNYQGKAVDLQGVTRRGGVARFRLAADGTVTK